MFPGILNNNVSVFLLLLSVILGKSNCYSTKDGVWCVVLGECCDG